MAVHYSHQTAHKPQDQTLNNWLMWKKVDIALTKRRLYAINRLPAVGSRPTCRECGLKIRTTMEAHVAGADHNRNSSKKR